jgi:hypothetical protein
LENSKVCEEQKMTREDIIRMAKECGNWSGQTVEMNVVGLERFAKLVAAAEREACAKVVEDYCGAWDDKGYALAAAIRARSKQ